ncbi:putative pilin/flagellin [Halanaeroarchaeum sp. HSR-CO]|uniref:DUF7288 family protein n=1 Tax=Halanaeroarchaeum sp. HSR-CO TaxID=2866382 RepID=UPI00217CF110|nr:hypothetical protein [Halanaeroarchaeum sp. HSR-CO]UWG47717.1 putative pilin/flagellin [Halanaeroarchaeum sp. HSR-CO]
MVSEDRGQGHTLEGIAAALLIITSVAFALQVTAVTPLTASTASQHVETQYESAATGVLATGAADGHIGPTLRYWNESDGGFHNSSADGYYIGQAPPTAFGDDLAQAFGSAGVAYNVDVTFATESGTIQDRRLVHYGQPSDTAVKASRTVVLYDTDRILDANGTPTDTTLEDANYFAPDAYDGHLYNVVVVEVTIWRM